jgi:hypothetical protein
LKNKIAYIIIVLFLQSFTILGQGKNKTVVYDHIIKYDTITVYDTVIVYDTIRAIENRLDLQYEKIFSKSNDVQNALIVIDTATLTAELILFNKKDTATISLNGIILSENNKNLGTMKKEILILAASAMLGKASYAQASKMDTLTYPKKYSVGAGIALPGIGGMLKFDYLKSRKTSFGVRAQFITSKTKTGTYPDYIMDGINYPGFTSKNKANEASNVFLTATYYFPKRGFCSKVGLYATVGTGYEIFRDLYQTRYTDGKWDNNSKYVTQNISGLVCIGTDYKIGRGKLFLDAPVTISFLEKSQSQIIYLNPAIASTSNYSSKPENFGYSGILNSIAVNLGYTYYFN